MTHPAADGSLATRHYPGYGYLQFRYHPDGQGDNFLWPSGVPNVPIRSTKRSVLLFPAGFIP